MPIISFVSPKGGAGKSTSALLLATELAYKGIGVTVIDGDPEQWIHQWGQGGNAPDSMTIVPKPADGRFEDIIIDEIEKAAAATPFVIVDLEGSANMTTSFAISRSDLAIIPTQPSTMDGKSAAKAIKLVKQQERAFKRNISFAVLFTRTSAVIKSRLEKDIAEQMQLSSIPVFNTQILERNAYKAIFAYSCTLEDLPKGTYKINDAISNARAFAGEVLSMFQPQTQTPQEIEKEEVMA